MDSPGKILKKERETENISLAKICFFTKIKEHHLESIEEDRYERLPHPLYVRGYLKSYAKCLALDEGDILNRYETYLKSLLPPDPPEPEPKIPPPKKHLRPFPPSLLIILLLLCASVFMTNFLDDPSDEQPASSLILPVTPATAIPREEQGQVTDPVQPEGGQELENNQAGASPTSVFEIVEAGIGTNIEKGKEQHFPAGKALELSSNHQKGYFFTRIRSPKPGKIAHVWLWEGKEHHRIEMDVKPPAWSVYSFLTFQPRHQGNWKAEAREGDRVLTSLNFKVLQ